VTLDSRPIDSGPIEAAKPGPRSWRRLLVDLAERGAVPIGLVLVFVYFALFSHVAPLFRSKPSLLNILGNQSVTGLIALAMLPPLIAGYFDLSVAAIAGVANIAAASMIGQHGLSIAAVIPLTLVVALLVGSVNGFLVATLNLNAFVITLGTYTLLGGLIQLYTGGQIIEAGFSSTFGKWGSENVLGLPTPFWLLMIVAFVLWYLHMQVPGGRKLESIGSNEIAARLVGIRVRRTVFLSFLGSSLIAGIAGLLLTSRSGGGDPNAGPQYLFPAIAAVFIGATTIRPGFYNVWGTIIGVFFIAVAVAGLSLNGASTWVTPVFNGAALVLAVAVSTIIGRNREQSA
jgi:ribose transport system permease protein